MNEWTRRPSARSGPAQTERNWKPLKGWVIFIGAAMVLLALINALTVDTTPGSAAPVGYSVSSALTT